MSWQPYRYITALSGVTGATASTLLFTPGVATLFVVAYSLDSASATVLGSTAILSLTYTQGGVTKTITSASVSLQSTGNAASMEVPIWPDASTNVNYSVAYTGAGSYNLHLGYRQPS